VSRSRAATANQTNGFGEASATVRQRALTWAQRLKRILAIDIEVCRSCGGRLRVIASIEAPALIDRILEHLGRDGESVWTGSTNWTTDSWTLQENVIVLTHAPAVAAEYARNFEELWSSGDVDRSGHEEPRTMDVEGRQARAWFTPGHGEELSHRIARAIGRARERIRIASPVITAGPVLGTLAQVAAEARVDVRGVVDRTQMEQVVYQWRTNGRSAWKVPILGSVLEHADFRGKPSTRYSPETPHDFMHAKVTVADDWVFGGSFNLSRSGERNAENVLELHDPELAERVASYIDEVRERYDAMPAPGDGRPT
jgi:phosphatidylserine/phosphatidylglycerophosphate/cardiolipin synthase-like enzyme